MLDRPHSGRTATSEARALADRIRELVADDRIRDPVIVAQIPPPLLPLEGGAS